MTLLSDLDNVQSKKSHCGVAKVIGALSATEGAALAKALDNLNSSPTDLARILRSNGYPISRQTINRHRNRLTNAEGCRCPRESG